MQNSRWWNAILGGVSGLTLITGVCQFWMNAGTSLPAQTALFVTILIALMAHACLPSRWRTGLLPQGVRLFVLSAWVAGWPSLFDFSWKLIAATGIDLSPSLTAQCFGLTMMSLATLGVPLLCTMGLSSFGRQTVFGSSMAVAIGMGGIGLAQFIGPAGCGLVATVCGLATSLTAMIAWWRDDKAVGDTSNETDRRDTGLQSLFNIAALVAVGALWMIGQRIVRQLVPDSFALMTMETATLVFGVAVGRWVAPADQRRGLVMCGLGLSCWIWLCLALFPLGVRLALWENATISQVWLLQALRLVLAGVVLVPVGMSAGILIGPNRSVLSMAAVIVAIIATNWLLPQAGIWTSALFATSVLMGVALWRMGNLARPWSGKIARPAIRTLSRAAVAAMVLFTLTAPAWVRYRPELAAKVLFDTGVFVASRAATPWEQLPVLDEGRAALVVEGDRGTLTAWKFAGSRLLVRENGIPKGTLATDVQLAPRFVPDVLPTVLPLVTHDRPQSLLLLGLRAGEPVELATMFPLRRIVCIEADRGVAALCRSLPLIPGPSPQRGEGSDTQETQTSFNDERVEVRVCDPALAVRTMRERFDVIVASADQPSLPQSANGFTVESLHAAADCLNEEGVFSIRFQHIDLGPRSVRGLAKTMSAAFREVAAVEVAPGELLFLGTNGERGLAREGFLERWQRPNVRQLLASVGWDWSTPLRLPMLNHEALQELIQSPNAVENVASRSTWPFRLPLEVMRWENKLQQVQAELAPHERFLMAWGGDEASNADVAARLSEWELSRAIIRRHSDEFWAYRKQVKEHMTGSPRAMIQQAGHSSDDGLHPDDRRRLNYFRTIGELAKNTAPTEADLDRLRRFESPFDPLVSPFLHQEMVELTSRCPDRDAAAELHHRLAAIYFSTPADRSIRNVADALQFVNSTPDAIPNKVERYDHLNALLQMLLARWSARGEFRPTSSRVALNDIERSIAAAETTFATLDALSAEGVVPVAEWQARQQHLERRLVRPLRTYRGQVLQHYVKNERTKEAVESFPPDAESNDDR